MRVLLALLLLLTLTTSAYAECAWVLWEERDFWSGGASASDSSKEWTIHFARGTQADCEIVLVRVWQVRVKHNQPGADTPGIKDVKSAPGYVAVNYQTGGSTSYTFRCLPDTIDPRGPKGK